MRKSLRIFVFFLLVYIAHSETSQVEPRMKVITTLLPYKEFAEAVGRERVQVSVLIPPGASPHTYELTPGQLREVSEARVYLKVGSGVEFEEVWLGRIVALKKDIMVCNSSDGVKLREMEDHHQPEGNGHSSQRKDPHIWLSPRNAKVIVENIRDCFVRLDPRNIELYDFNLSEYIKRLDDIDREIEHKLLELKNRSFIVFHPAWGYFARDYGLQQTAVHPEGKEPSPRDIIRVIEQARAHGITTIFVSPHIDPRAARFVAKETDAWVGFADPLGEQYIENLREVADLIARNHE
jgi:zinc transport system substrate-binding protein